ncbi:ABC transporter ATP-binding protein [Marinobacterium lacunae]|nr:ABC transporter ATP-binding protein [Marinobacterium lacunae]
MSSYDDFDRAKTPVAIRLRQCSCTFNGSGKGRTAQTALHPLDLEIRAGETLVLLGPSGCGKTTTLRIISGLEQPDAGGEVWFGDEEVTNLPIEKRDVGMVFQNYALFPNMNVAANIAYGLRIKGLSDDALKRRVAEMVDMVHLNGYEQRRISELSGGQKQRVALARALAVRPRVLLFDEPLAALDAKLRDRLRVDIGQLLRNLGITAVYVTHDQAEAMALGDRIAVMEKGRIVQLGTPREIYHQPRTAFVADFIGNVNRFKVQGRDAEKLHVEGGYLRAGLHLDAPVLYCRPEDIEICAPDSAPLQGRVLQSVFLGQSQRLLVDTGGDIPLQVESDSRQRWFPGQPIGLSVAGEALFPIADVR